MIYTLYNSRVFRHRCGEAVLSSWFDELPLNLHLEEIGGLLCFRALVAEFYLFPQARFCRLPYMSPPGSVRLTLLFSLSRKISAAAYINYRTHARIVPSWMRSAPMANR